MLVTLRIGAAAAENSLEVPQKVKSQNHDMTQQSHFWVLVWRNPKHSFEKVYASPSSLRHCPQQPMHGSRPHAVDGRLGEGRWWVCTAWKRG